MEKEIDTLLPPRTWHDIHLVLKTVLLTVSALLCLGVIPNADHWLGVLATITLVVKDSTLDALRFF